MRGAGRRGSRKISSAPPLMHGLWTVTAPSIGVALAVAGLDPQQQRLAGLEHAQRVQPHARLGAVAADEALDRAVAEDDARSRPAGRWRGGRRGRPSRTRTARAQLRARRRGRRVSVRVTATRPSSSVWTGPLPTLTNRVPRCPMQPIASSDDQVVFRPEPRAGSRRRGDIEAVCAAVCRAWRRRAPVRLAIRTPARTGGRARRHRRCRAGCGASGSAGELRASSTSALLARYGHRERA